jgi:hypothetical protein
MHSACQRCRRFADQPRAALTSHIRPESLGFDPQSILKLGKGCNVNERPYQPSQESAHANTTRLKNGKVLADDGHIAFVEISEWTLRLPPSEPLGNQTSNIMALLDRRLGNSGDGSSVLHNGCCIADDEDVRCGRNVQTWTNGCATDPIGLGTEHFYDR